MAYRDFTLEDIELQFGIRNQAEALFNPETIETIAPSEQLRADLQEA